MHMVAQLSVAYDRGGIYIFVSRTLVLAINCFIHVSVAKCHFPSQDAYRILTLIES